MVPLKFQTCLPHTSGVNIQIIPFLLDKPYMDGLFKPRLVKRAIEEYQSALVYWGHIISWLLVLYRFIVLSMHTESTIFLGAELLYESLCLSVCLYVCMYVCIVSHTFFLKSSLFWYKSWFSTVSFYKYSYKNIKSFTLKRYEFFVLKKFKTRHCS